MWKWRWKKVFFIEKSQAQYNIPHAQYGRVPLGIKIIEPESMEKVRKNFYIDVHLRLKDPINVYWILTLKLIMVLEG